MSKLTPFVRKIKKHKHGSTTTIIPKEILDVPELNVWSVIVDTENNLLIWAKGENVAPNQYDTRFSNITLQCAMKKHLKCTSLACNCDCHVVTENE